MKTEIIEKHGRKIALVTSNEVLIADSQSALDFMMTVQYETEARDIALNKGALCEEFFDLKTKIAGEVLQKCSNYHIRFAIYGDFSGYASKALKDFIYESNSGNAIFFKPTADEAVEALVAQ